MNIEEPVTFIEQDFSRLELAVFDAASPIYKLIDS